MEYSWVENKERVEKAKKLASLNPYANALFQYAFENKGSDELWHLFCKSAGVSSVNQLEIFHIMSSGLRNGLYVLLDHDYADLIMEAIGSCIGKQYDTGYTRHSFRSQIVSNYRERISLLLNRTISMFYSQNGPLGIQKNDIDFYRNMPYLLAIKIKHNEKQIIDTINEMIEGENNVLLSRGVIEAILLGNNEELKDKLLQLLKAAKLQEGLRQSVLESADIGDCNTFKKVFGFAVENDLFRYTSAIRACFTWCGISVEKIDPAKCKGFAENAYQCLMDPSYAQKCFDSNNPTDIYLSLWALANEEINNTVAKVKILLNDDNRIRKMTGLYFADHIKDEVLKNTLACQLLDEQDAEMLAYISRLLYAPPFARLSGYKNESYYNRMDLACIPQSTEGKKQRFYQMVAILKSCGSKNIVFEPSLFPFHSITYDGYKFNCLLLYLCDKLKENEYKDAVEDTFDKMDPYARSKYYRQILDPKLISGDVKRLQKGLKDKSIENRLEVLKALEKANPIHLDLPLIVSLFESKSEKMRKATLEFVEKLPLSLQQSIFDSLFEGSEQQKQIAMEMLMNNKLLKQKNATKAVNLANESLSQQSAILQKQVLQATKELTVENGYGIYDVKVVRETLNGFQSDNSVIFKKKGLFSLNPDSDYRILLSYDDLKKTLPSKSELKRIFDQMLAVIQKHSDYEYKTIGFDNLPKAVIFGTEESFYGEYHEGLSEKQLKSDRMNFEKVPFYKELAQAVLSVKNSCRQIVFLYYLTELLIHSEYDRRFNDNGPTYRFENQFVNDFVCFDNCEKYRPYIRRLQKILKYLLSKMDEGIIFRTYTQLLFSLIDIVGTDFLKSARQAGANPATSDLADTHHCFHIAFDLLKRTKMDDVQFSIYFKNMLLYEEKVPSMHLKVKEYLRAICLGIIDKNVLFYTLLSNKKYSDLEIRTFTKYMKNENLSKEEEKLKKQLAKEFASGIVAYESQRGQKNTELSEKAMRVSNVYGAVNFCTLLKTLGEEKFNRYTSFLYGNLTKSELLSSLMRYCWPESTDTSEILKEQLERTGISEKRLVEAAMYAPQWAKLIGNLVDYKDLNKAVWFFHAHINEQFEEWKEREVAIYSPIKPQQFNDGAFDIAWYREIEKELTSKQMKLLYDSAKYITEGSNAHRRSQLYVDAISNKLDCQKTEEEIRDKRNQDKLRAYALIPLKDNDADLIHRYDVICEFGKGSSAFGAQKRASENKAVLSALDNLSLNCGFFDVNRMMWFLEGKKSAAMQCYYDGITIDNCVIKIDVDEFGDCELSINKDGKSQKTLPKELAKDERILLMKDALKELKKQKSRNRMSLENAMVNQSEFTEEELLTIYDAPVLRALISRLIWVDQNNHFGLIESKNGVVILTDANGNEKPVEKEDILKIAHPHHLIEAGLWSDYMHLIYNRELIQPFKQVFREYYPLSPQEKEENNCSRRYAGIQIQKSKTLGLLKNRGWVVNYEEGFNKVFYRESLVAHLYTYANWFTPSDIEEPSLEEIYFEDRYSGKQLKLSEINPIAFSETMRDLDLVVSCAYVGGVNIETSQSTVDMRISIAKELLRLLKLENVTFTDHFALVKGKLAEYKIHMGSGTVNVDAKGILPVFPVHSQQRGHIFLPFVDEDPKTAQILSEIITFAQDNKLKDPTILQWLQK